MSVPKPTKPLLIAYPGKIHQHFPASPTQSKDDWLYSGPEGKNDQGGPVLFYRYDLTDQDSWETVAEVAGYSDIKELIRVNFDTDVPEEVNWYLGHWVGCNRTRDGINYSFSASAHPGFLWMPRKKGEKVRRPKVETRDCRLYVLLPEQILKLPWSTSVLRTSSGGVAKVGMRVSAPEGIRLLLSISMTHVVFVVVSVRSPEQTPLLGKVIQQSLSCAQSDIDRAWGKDVYEKTKGGKALARAEVEILMGMVAGTGRFAGWAYSTAKMFDYMTVNGDKILRMAKAVRVIWESMGQIRALSPKFYEVMKECLYEGAVSTLGEFGSAVAGDPADAFGKVVGVIVSDVGPEILTGRLEATKFLGKGLEFIVDAAKEKAGNAFQTAVKDYDDKAGNLAFKFQSSGVAISREDLIKIREEVTRNPDAIKAALDRMTKSMEAL